MSAQGRLILFLLAALAGLPLGLAGLSSLPEFGTPIGSLGDLINRAGVAERQVTNLVTAVMFDYRALDTLGEEFMLLAAVVGLMLLLREARGHAAEAPPRLPEGRILEPRSEAIVVAGRWGAVLLALFGLYVVLHAHLTPGGGFQGGAMIGSALLLVYLGEGYRVWRQVSRPPVLELAEGLGGALFVCGGLASLLTGGVFLENRLPLGTTGDLLSGGAIPLLNLAAALAVAAGFALAIGEFLEETREPEREE